MTNRFIQGEVGIEAVLNSQDGLYYLVGRAVEPDDLPPGPDVSVTAAQDIALVTTIGQWSAVEVNISGALTRQRLPASAWDHVAEATMDITQPLLVADMEFAPVAGADPIELDPGRYLIQVYARSPETIARQRPQQTKPDTQWNEEHLIVISPTSSHG